MTAEAKTIPEDIMDTARSVAMKIAAVLPVTGSEDVNHIALAIFAERERCARIAEGRSKSFDFQKALSDYDDMAYGSNVVRSEIALAIRSSHTPTHPQLPKESAVS